METTELKNIKSLDIDGIQIPVLDYDIQPSGWVEFHTHDGSIYTAKLVGYNSDSGSFFEVDWDSLQETITVDDIIDIMESVFAPNEGSQTT